MLALVVGAAIWLVKSRPLKQSFGLPDGTTMTLYKVTYGTNHEVPYSGNWRDYIYPFLPRNLRTNLGAKVISFGLPGIQYSSSAASLTSGTNNLVVWLKRTGTIPTTSSLNTNPLPPRLRVSVVDENGLEATPAQTRTFTGATLSAYLLQNYPRRSKTIHLRFADSSVPTTALASSPILADFEIPNPEPSKAPPWVAEPLPATRETNGVEISLLELETGNTQAGMLRIMNAPNVTVATALGRGVAANTNRTYSQAKIDIRDHGQRAPGWTIQTLRASTPTGVNLSLRGSRRGSDDSGTFYFFSGILWPEEPAWELTVEAWKTTNFSDEELWTLKNLHIPEFPNTYGEIGQTNLNGVQLSLRMSRQARNVPPRTTTTYITSSGGVITTNITTIGGGFGNPQADQVVLTASITNVPSDVHVIFVEVSTESGINRSYGTGTSTSGGSISSLRPFPVPSPPPVITTSYTYNFTMPDNSQTVNVKLAVTRSRFATFRVKPTLAKPSP